MSSAETESLKGKDRAEESPRTWQEKCKAHLRQNLLLVLTLCGILGGILLGFVGRNYEPSPKTIVLIGFPGEMLLRILKMLILPLIISSLITGLAQLDPQSSGKMGSMAIVFYISSTAIATTTGVITALILRPGRQKLTGAALPPKINREPISTLDAMLDIVRNAFPDNIVQAASQSIATSYTRVVVNTSIVTNNTVTFKEIETLITNLKYVDGTNVMGLVVFCIIFGIFISQYKSEAQVMYDFFYVMNELIMKIVGLIMWYSPVGILFLVAANILKIDNMQETAERLSLYMFTVIVGLAFHALITMNLIYFLIVRKNPFVFLKGMLQAWLTAIGTASSSATLPITFKCLEENNKIDKRVTRFMLPLGATINMDGTALYQCIATVFISQLNGVDFGIGQLVTVCLISTATSIGVASVPSASLVTMLIILSTMGLPTEHLSFIIAVDWLLDRLRTSVNVLGDSYGCGIIAKMAEAQLKKLDENAENELNKILHHKKMTFDNIQQLTSRSRQSSIHEELEANPSIQVMEAYRRHSKNIIFADSTIPESIASMPQISVYQTSPKTGNH